ncbi:hypothetical protein QBC33DRAFT_298598 [Phialemonium atrogriseum]|uniref:Spp2/MOS2 G-patch domain-containing protein n=1 Tax=Phialemonium atrogriseum TaxID=1093897 RepID=A0AAJ0C4L5_9PEZI|nr:uncharacterized protein QBC33DRAFT_298598 [Phialemonium atrogriseum]KAK1769816.1 hypothetical protein QBC33DRAFT_298598 [Phialemonium atrogriseum]
MADSGGAPSRVAIKFGTPKGSESKKHSSRTKPTSLGKRHRAHALNDDSESDAEEAHPAVRHETITGYGPGGASLDDRRSPRHRRRRSDSPDGGRRAGRDSRSGRRGYRDERAAAAERNGSLKEVDPADKDKAVKWGLTINSKPRQRDEERSARERDGGDQVAGDEKRGGEKAPKTADEEAMEALTMDPAERKRLNYKNISSGDLDRDPLPEDYKSIPVEDFGATLLRGFGWDGKMRGKIKEVAKHGNLTGLGAKNLREAEDLGAWSQKSTKDSNGKSRPARAPRLDDYRREEEKKRQRRQDRHGDSYRHEKERERERGADRR